jgi:inorganic triphosphatase YgiF
VTASHLEHERTFDGGSDAVLPDLSGLPGVRTVEPAGSEELDAVYCDTADHRLLAHHITLRRRTGGHDAGWHLKLPEGTDRRRELRLPVDAGGGPDHVPADLELRVRAYARGQSLGPVARLHTHRHRRLLLDGTGSPMAEIAEDTVSARVPER